MKATLPCLFVYLHFQNGLSQSDNISSPNQMGGRNKKRSGVNWDKRKRKEKWGVEAVGDMGDE